MLVKSYSVLAMIIGRILDVISPLLPLVSVRAGIISSVCLFTLIFLNCYSNRDSKIIMLKYVFLSYKHVIQKDITFRDDTNGVHYGIGKDSQRN